MQQTPPKSRHKLYGGIAASVALHVIIAVALFARLPAPDPMPPKEDTVSVEIVPPAEQQKPEEKKPEEKPQKQALNLKMPEQKPEEDKQPPAPPPEPPKQQAEKAGAKPPEQAASVEEKQAEEKPPVEKVEQASPPPPVQPEKKAGAEQPPPPPPAAPEQAKEQTPSPPPPAEEKAPEQQDRPQSEQPPSQQPPADTAADEPAQGRPLPALRPVFAFGDKDKGSKVEPDGTASQEGEIAKADDAETTDTSDSPEDKSEETTSETDADVAKDTDPPAPTLPQNVAPPVLSAANADALASSDEASSEKAGSGKGNPDGIQAEISSQAPSGSAKSEKTATDKKAGGKPLKEAKRLFSLRDTSDDVAMAAMGGIPRSTRAGQLCATELREQLRHGSPAYQPEILPSYGLPQGNVLDIRNAAFRANSQWFDVRFRCEIDENATKVVSFGVEVGNAVPRSQWKARRFPEY